MNINLNEEQIKSLETTGVAYHGCYLIIDRCEVIYEYINKQQIRNELGIDVNEDIIRVAQDINSQLDIITDTMFESVRVAVDSLESFSNIED